jgi:CheY-like chemotaxis protein
MKRIDKGEPPRGPRQVHRELLLYVEDDDTNWQVAELRLNHGYELIRAASSSEACRVVRARGNDLAGILMDIELRGSELNGVELTKALRGKPLEGPTPSYAVELPVLAYTPIIFVTAHNAKYSDAQLVLAGGDKVIPKPVDFGTLSVALTQLHLTRASRMKRTRG